MRWLLPAAVLICGIASASTAALHVQTDWSGGPQEPGPVPAWTDRFALAHQTSWRSVPGQLALTSVPTTPTGGFVTDQAPNCETGAAGDLDGDGDIDLMTALPLTSFPGTGKVRWFENGGDGETWTEHEVDDDFYGGAAITAADIDGDLDLDIVAAAFYGDPQENGRYVWYENADGQAGSWLKHPIAGLFYGTEFVGTADIDDDGDLDVYGCSTLTYIGNINDDLYWFENVDGAGVTWTQHAIDDDFPDAIDAAAADVDLDGDQDVVCVAYGTHDLAWWENLNGGGTGWMKHPITGFTTVDADIAVGDLDDDGDVDIAATGFNAASVDWYENLDGQGGVWARRVVGPMNDGVDVTIADLNGDGYLDVLAASSDLYNSVVLWYANLGQASAWATHVVNSGHDDGHSAFAAELDGDGALEVVFTEEGSDPDDVSGLHRRNITAFVDSGELESAILDGGSPSTWTAIGWDATVPTSTEVRYQVRSSNDPSNLGPWSEDITEPGSLAGILEPDTRYVQYRVLLGSMDPGASPLVREISIESATPSSIPDPEADQSTGDSEFVVMSLGVPAPNPTSGAGTITIDLEVDGWARLDVFDAMGRRVSTPLSGRLNVGKHSVRLPELSAGVYFVRLSSGERSLARKLTVR